ncbi:hypothetical protein OG455_06615 [Kitasatospora sp. NBC_01287]|uniref:hypothetical protein n=1 Tax=Kitasatospora sp. NBC_01287 TaxID=2903573 RepID=UPI0022527AEB|nr:hypothetical protein [Kitasatospora sp. NBC_01287]MCX4745195.1 hypothetical protein [Kitasatospora sp. NBC_01287]
MGSNKRSAGQQQSRKKCLFCSSNADSAEHIFADWLHRAYGGGEGVRTWTVDGTPVTEKGGPFSKKLKIVCRPCNNVWMSSMEEKAKPALVKMFDWDGKATLQLDSDEQIALARWGFKTAVVAAHVSGRPVFPLQQCQDFRASDTLPQCWIRIGLGDSPPPRDYFGDNIRYDLVGECDFLPANATMLVDGVKTTFPFYRAAFRLFNVVCDVMGYHLPGAEITATPPPDHQDALTQIWPNPASLVTWPPKRTVDSIGGVHQLVSSR